MSIETRTSRLVKKTGVEKSRWTVPLRAAEYSSDIIGRFAALPYHGFQTCTVFAAEII